MDGFVPIEVFVAVIMGVSVVVFSIYMVLVCLLVSESRKRKLAVSKLKKWIAGLEDRQDKLEADIKTQRHDPKDFLKCLEISQDYLQSLGSPSDVKKPFSKPNIEPEAPEETSDDTEFKLETLIPILPGSDEHDYDDCYYPSQPDDKKKVTLKTFTKEGYDYVDCRKEDTNNSAKTEEDYDYADCNKSHGAVSSAAASSTSNVPLSDSLSSCTQTTTSREEEAGEINLAPNIAYKQVVKA